MADDVEMMLRVRGLGDKLQRLARLAPTDVHAIELIVDDCLRHRWPRTVKAWLKVDLLQWRRRRGAG